MRIVTGQSTAEAKNRPAPQFLDYFPTDTEGMSSLYLHIHAMSFLFFLDMYLLGTHLVTSPADNRDGPTKKIKTF